MTARKRRAEVVFLERPFSGHGLPGWTVRLVNPDQVLDGGDGDRPVGSRGFHASISYSRPYGSLEGYGEDTPAGAPYRYQYMTQGRHAGGRRYGAARTVTEAQEAVAAWARRRFYYAEEA